MAKGFIYVVTTVTRGYIQKAFRNVPTQWGDRLYFGPCKKPMRPKMRVGDYVFGISSSSTPSRRIVFVGQIEERMRFGEAYERFPELRGPEGPIHVRPVKGAGAFPTSEYEHIPGAMHGTKWKADLETRDRDAFFVCARENGWVGRWLGPNGPQIDDEMLAFLQTCSVHGASGCLSTLNPDATVDNPVAYGRLYTGLHLETDQAEQLLEMCAARMTDNGDDSFDNRIVTPERRPRVGSDATTVRIFRDCR